MHASSLACRISVAQLLRIALIAVILLAVARPGDCSVGGVYTAQQTSQNKSVKTIGYEAETPANHTISPDEIHRFYVQLRVGQFLLITITQKELDVTASLIGKNDEPIITMDDNSRDIEFMPFVADETKEYTFEVKATSPIKSPKQYEITFSRPSLPTPIEAKWASIEKDNAVAATVEQKNSKLALDMFKKAAAGFRAINKLNREVSALYSVGELYFKTDRKQMAITFFEKALAVSRGIGHKDMEASCLAQAAFLYSALGKKQRALDYNLLALAIFRDVVKNPFNQAGTLNNLGLIFDDIGEKQKALESYEQSRTVLVEAYGDDPEVRIQMGLLDNNMAGILIDFREFDKALDLVDKSLKEAEGDSYTESLALNNKGQVYLTLGDPKAALRFLEKALVAGQKVDYERREEIISWSNIGHAKTRLEDRDGAIKAYQNAERLAVQSKDPQGRAVATYSLGKLLFEKGDRVSALRKFSAALSLANRVEDREGQAIILNSIGDTQLENGKIPSALKQYSKAFRVSQAKGLEAARDYALYGMARVAYRRRQFIPARRLIQTVVDRVEAERQRVHTKDLRAAFLASKRMYYDFYIDLLMDMHSRKPGAGYNVAAFEMGERMRARTLLELLSEANANIPRNVPAELIQERRALSQRLSDKSDVLLSLPRTNVEEVTAIRRDIELLTIQMQRLEANMINQSPAYANLAKPTPLTLPEVQQRVIDDESVLLHYTMTESKVYLWSITKNHFESYTLPSKQNIENAVLDFRSVVSTRGRWNSGGEPSLIRGCYETTMPEVARQLSEMLVNPVAEILSKRKRLLIVSDGALQYLPFSALPTPVNANGEIGYAPLGRDHEIINLPSASSMAVIREEPRRKKFLLNPTIVFADPVFDINDERLGNSLKVKPDSKDTINVQPSIALERAAKSSSDENAGTLPRLPSTRTESNAIVALLKPGEGKELLDFDASRDHAINDDIENFRYVHFATHGWLDGMNPELSGVVLSLFDEQGNRQSGFLQLHDIYNLNLNAELVVLSACKTGLATDVKGEGLVGLTRGFMYAGSPRVVVSLWSVSDISASELMKRFYKEILTNNKRPAEALYLAQRSMSCDKEFNDPYYWAAFVFQGEWN